MNKFNEYLEAAIELRESDIEELNEISLGKKLGTLGKRTLGAVTGGRFGKEKYDQNTRKGVISNIKTGKRDEAKENPESKLLLQKRYKEMKSLLDAKQIGYRSSDEMKEAFRGFKGPGGYKIAMALMNSGGDLKSFINQVSANTENSTEVQRLLTITLKDAIEHLKNK